MGFPLNNTQQPVLAATEPPVVTEAQPVRLGTTEALVVELGCEELPPADAKSGASQLRCGRQCRQ